MNALVQRCPHCLRLNSVVIKSLSTISVSSSQKATTQQEIPAPHSQYDYVSRPNPDSNIRRVVYSKATSPEEEVLNVKRALTNDWNDSFWKVHNQNFFQAKKEFIASSNAASGTGQEVSDKLSVFYKDFLENNHDTYMKYNREWYGRNFNLLWMDFKSTLLKPFSRQKKTTTPTTQNEDVL